MKKILISFVELCIIFMSLFSQRCIAVDKADAEDILKEAEDFLASAYVAVVDAEKAGANVSDIFERLRLAGEYLAEANNKFRLGEYDRAYDYAREAINKIENIVSKAEVLRDEAQRSRSERLFLSAAYSSVGLSFLFVFSLFGWRHLKRLYVKRVLKMKPEVTRENEPG